MSSLRARWILAALWLGGLAAVGLIGAPTAFAVIPDKMLAAAVASRMFYVMALAAVALGGLLMVLERAHARPLAVSTPFFLVLGGLFFTVLGEFVVVPQLLSAAAAHAASAGMWHAVASLVYLLQAICVFAYVWTLAAAAARQGR
ncbi:MAG: DUF4149 domain-containing protein [Betaproteobacteria bacterium]|jgi:hypothetical protein|uniref:TMEM205-like domain-containing protein n=1 Tax=Thiomonas delicata TaxID=364030 RepID=A0A238D6C0_THIDL|nr:DUF4149 domain-containing protein [Thiomonas delicata]MDE2128807.1 DUF4149 domain-containing protein [Betaproteobacteria bacterium]OZB51204.1 MAG: hypothetical protein B7X42_03710 [Thiomonas sp. 14-66-4]OZB65178.1 MAG: hypothetical protein B7X31_02700 [Thiomonas sp. 13-66-29]SBP88856.1 conserved membrane hypothetical protein [Thiomonas delicata]